LQNEMAYKAEIFLDLNSNISRSKIGMSSLVI